MILWPQIISCGVIHMLISTGKKMGSFANLFTLHKTYFYIGSIFFGPREKEQFAFWISPTLCSSVVCNWMLCCCHCDTMLVMGPDWDNVSTKLWCCRVSALIRNITDAHRLCCGHFSSTPILLQICFSVLSSHNSHLRTRHLYLYDHRCSHFGGGVLWLFALWPH